MNVQLSKPEKNESFWEKLLRVSEGLDFSPQDLTERKLAILVDRQEQLEFRLAELEVIVEGAK